MTDDSKYRHRGGGEAPPFILHYRVRFPLALFPSEVRFPFTFTIDKEDRVIKRVE